MSVAAERYAGEWGLFVDWCRATDRSWLPATQGTVLAFLDEEVRSAGAAAGYLAGITAHHVAAGYPSPCRGVVTSWVAATRAGAPITGPGILAGLAEAVSRVPVAGWPTGMVGRRDRLAWLLHRLGGVATGDLCALSTDDLHVTGPGTVALTVRDAPVALYQDEGASPGLCVACAVTRWAQVLRHHRVFAHRILADKLTATPGGLLDQTSWHVCDRAPVPAPDAWWPRGWPLLYGIDHRGHPTGVPVPDPIAPRALGEALRGIDHHTWARRPAPPPPARYDNQMPHPAATVDGQTAVPAPSPSQPVPVATNPAWHRNGMAARTRGHALLADADAALDALDAAAARMQQRMQAILDTEAP